MGKEYSSLMNHGTWDLVDLPEDRNLVGCKWVFKTKRKANGEIDKFKARLVAQGYSQEAPYTEGSMEGPLRQLGTSP